MTSPKTSTDLVMIYGLDSDVAVSSRAFPLEALCLIWPDMAV